MTWAVGSRRLDGGGFQESRRDERPLRRKAAIPRCCTKLRRDPPWPIPHRPDRPDMHDLDNPAGRACATRDGQLTAVSSFGLVVFETGEDGSLSSIDIQHCKVRRHFSAAE